MDFILNHYLLKNKHCKITIDKWLLKNKIYPKVAEKANKKDKKKFSKQIKLKKKLNNKVSSEAN